MVMQMNIMQKFIYQI